MKITKISITDYASGGVDEPHGEIVVVSPGSTTVLNLYKVELAALQQCAEKIVLARGMHDDR